MVGIRKSSSTGNLQAALGSFLSAVHVTSTGKQVEGSGGEKQLNQTAGKKQHRRRRSNNSIWEDALSVETLDSKLEEIPKKSESELMAELFQTANELEEMAKKARRARRRKKTVRRTKSNVSHDGASSCLSSCGAAEDKPRNKAPTAITSTTVSKEKPVRRRSFSGGFSNLVMGGINFSLHSKPKQEATATATATARTISKEFLTSSTNNDTNNTDNHTTATNSSSRQPELPMDLYRPTFYHDSDDEDDDLVLAPEESLDEYSRQVQQEVMNMTINIHWNSPQAA